MSKGEASNQGESRSSSCPQAAKKTDMEAVPDVPVQVSEQGEAQDQASWRRQSSNGSGLEEATEPEAEALQSSSRGVQQPGSRYPANHCRLH
jgi:hypothetical protein